MFKGSVRLETKNSAPKAPWLRTSSQLQHPLGVPSSCFRDRGIQARGDLALGGDVPDLEKHGERVQDAIWG